MSSRRRRQRQRRQQPPPGSPAADGQEHTGLWSDASLSELRLLRRAIRADWPIPDERRDGLIEEVSSLIDSDRARVAISVAWVYIEADRANLRARKAELRAEQERQRDGVVKLHFLSSTLSVVSGNSADERGDRR
jgi:hypothetical protein